MNPAGWFERHARRRPDDPALADGERVHASWGAFAARAAGAATSLRDHFGLIWPPFADVPVSKTLDDLKRLKEEIMPKVEAI
jgi:acyl-CoA synthetase (AMP-forming)/AMP-acid ligase II